VLLNSAVIYWMLYIQICFTKITELLIDDVNAHCRVGGLDDF